MGDIPVAPQAANKLHEMKAKTDISVVLSRNVSPEVEKVIKDLLTSKLHLDVTAGDAVVVRRIELPSDPKIEESPKKLPELTWKTWTLVVILSLLALAGLMFAVWRRAKAQDPKKEVTENHDYNHHEAKPEAKTEEPASVVVAATPEPTVEPEKPAVWDLDLDSVRQHVVQIAHRYPQMASRAIAEYCLEKSPENSTYLMDFLGWDVAKQVFTEVPAMAWAKMGRTMKDRQTDPTAAQIEAGVRETYRALLGAYIEHEMTEDEQNPFSFVLKMRDEERQQILDKESARNIAIFCLHAPAEVTAGILATMDGEKKVRVMSELSRIEKLPHDVVQVVIQSFHQRMMEMRVKPEPKIQGATVLARVIRGMTPEEEMDMLALFANENPEELERVRRSILIFDDLKVTPLDIVGEVLGGFEVEALYAAFFRTPTNFFSHALSSLPEKKAMIVERDLADMVVIPPRKLTAQIRRTICQQVEAELNRRSIRLSDLIEGNMKVRKIAQ